MKTVPMSATRFPSVYTTANRDGCPRKADATDPKLRTWRRRPAAKQSSQPKRRCFSVRLGNIASKKSSSSLRRKLGVTDRKMSSNPCSSAGLLFTFAYGVEELKKYDMAIGKLIGGKKPERGARARARARATAWESSALE